MIAFWPLGFINILCSLVRDLMSEYFAFDRLKFWDASESLGTSPIFFRLFFNFHKRLVTLSRKPRGHVRILLCGAWAFFPTSRQIRTGILTRQPTIIYFISTRKIIER